MNEEDKLIEDQFKTLPLALQSAIKEMPWKSRVNEISLLNTLSLEQVESVERETMFVIYGFEPPQNYIPNLIREAQIEEEVATEIAEVVNEKILKEISNKATQKEAITSTPTETKEEAMQRLMGMRGETKAKAPAIEEHNLPMVEAGEAVHDVPHDPKLDKEQPPAFVDPRYAEGSGEARDSGVAKEEQERPKLAETPNYTYQAGQDPYREPLN